MVEVSFAQALASPGGTWTTKTCGNWRDMELTRRQLKESWRKLDPQLARSWRLSKIQVVLGLTVRMRARLADRKLRLRECGIGNIVQCTRA